MTFCTYIKTQNQPINYSLTARCLMTSKWALSSFQEDIFETWQYFMDKNCEKQIFSSPSTICLLPKDNSKRKNRPQLSFLFSVLWKCYKNSGQSHHCLFLSEQWGQRPKTPFRLLFTKEMSPKTQSFNRSPLYLVMNIPIILWPLSQRPLL